MGSDIRRGTVEMTAAMLISGTIGWFVVMSGQPVSGVVFWRCLFGALTLLVIKNGLTLVRVDPLWLQGVYGLVILVAIGIDTFIVRRAEQARQARAR